jgi:MOSC domain-containing protein YiiM
MRTCDELERLWQALPDAPRDRGEVHLLVRRPERRVHEVLEEVELSVEGGVIGDRWARGEADRRCQVTLMNVRVAELVTHDDQPLHMPGDNLLVDLDLSAEALPIGARLRVGTALLEVTPEPHTGCALFAERFGADALRWTNGRTHGDRRLRGINCEVIESGRVAIGDRIERLPPDQLS